MARRLLARYDHRSLGFAVYTYLRFLLCPYDRVARYVPPRGRLLDVGCGFGLWLTYLSLTREELDLYGIDVDERKLAVARTLRDRRIHILDAAQFEWPADQFDAVTVVDVMYLVKDDATRRLFQSIHAALRPGGVLLLKEIDVRPRWKYALGYAQEALAVNLLHLTAGTGLHFRPMERYGQLARECGFTGVNLRRLDHGYPHPSVLLIGTKAA